MPIFEYICKDCQHEFEALVFGKQRAECPKCQSKKLEPQLSVFAVSAKSASVQGQPCRPGLVVLRRSSRTWKLFDERPQLSGIVGHLFSFQVLDPQEPQGPADMAGPALDALLAETAKTDNCGSNFLLWHFGLRSLLAEDQRLDCVLVCRYVLMLLKSITEMFAKSSKSRPFQTWPAGTHVQALASFCHGTSVSSTKG